jgi:ribosomal protein L12E/L44/L45/RPP1/RPP2
MMSTPQTRNPLPSNPKPGAPTLEENPLAEGVNAKSEESENKPPQEDNKKKPFELPKQEAKKPDDPYGLEELKKMVSDVNDMVSKATVGTTAAELGDKALNQVVQKVTLPSLAAASMAASATAFAASEAGKGAASAASAAYTGASSVASEAGKAVNEGVKAVVDSFKGSSVKEQSNNNASNEGPGIEMKSISSPKPEPAMDNMSSMQDTDDLNTPNINDQASVLPVPENQSIEPALTKESEKVGEQNHGKRI